MKTLGTNLGLPSWSYTPDGEGRIESISASSGQNPLSSTSYSAFGPTGITFGSGDSDTFSYDSYTGRQTKYQFTVNGAVETGALTWNANGTLQQLAITDPFNSTDTQTCKSTYDDLERLVINNCGSIWNQTFSYDAFGNLAKSWTTSFQPTYNLSTNRYNTLPAGTPSYDANGNILTDGFHSYGWNVEGLNTEIDSNATTLTYDALGRWVERHNSGTPVQAVYAPDGTELVVATGQNVVTGYLRLPAGAIAQYLTSGLGNYWHPDWLGTTRLYSNLSHTIVGDIAYAPFGEPYVWGGSIDSYFTGVARNVEANDFRNFPARDLHTTQGRWLTPDPAAVAAADPTDPQTWNRYAYVRNNPLANIDPSGMNCVTLDSGATGDDGQGTTCPGSDVPDKVNVNAGSEPVGTWAWWWNGGWRFVNGASQISSSTGGGGSRINSATQPPPKNAPTYPRLSKDQCQAIRTVLAREAKFGTPAAARMSSNTFGDGTLAPLNSSYVPNIKTPAGELDVDWYTDLQAWGLGFQPIVYPVAKTLWTITRAVSGLPIGHAFPFGDPGERTALVESMDGGYSDIFTPAYMQQACPNY